MGWMLAILVGVVGFLLAYNSHFAIPISEGQYLSLAALAGMRCRSG